VYAIRVQPVGSARALQTCLAHMAETHIRAKFAIPIALFKFGVHGSRKDNEISIQRFLNVTHIHTRLYTRARRADERSMCNVMHYVGHRTYTTKLRCRACIQSTCILKRLRQRLRVIASIAANKTYISWGYSSACKW